MTNGIGQGAAIISDKLGRFVKNPIGSNTKGEAISVKVKLSRGMLWCLFKNYFKLSKKVIKKNRSD